MKKLTTIILTIIIAMWPITLEPAKLAKVNLRAFRYPVMAGLYVQYEQDGKWFNTGYIKEGVKK